MKSYQMKLVFMENVHSKIDQNVKSGSFTTEIVCHEIV